jgi:HSP20 family molecular chaperone IbpA
MKKILAVAVSTALLGAGGALAAGGSMGSGSSGPGPQGSGAGAAPQYPTYPGSYAAGDQSYMPDYTRSGQGYGFGSGSRQGGPSPMYGTGMPQYGTGQQEGEQSGAQQDPAQSGMPYGGYAPPYGPGPMMPGYGYGPGQGEGAGQGYGPGMPPYGYGMPGYGGPQGGQPGDEQGAWSRSYEYGTSRAPGRPQMDWDRGLPWYGWPPTEPGPAQGYGRGMPQPSRGGLYPYSSRYGIEMDQTEEGYEFFVPLKGVPSEEVNVEVRGRQLLVARDERMSRQSERPGDQGYSRSYSYSFGSFRRSLTIPRDADPSGLSYEATGDGIRIFLPRQPQ